MNTLLRSLALALAITLTMPSAFADKELAKEQKAEAKVAKGDLKTVSKLSKSWEKATAKGKEDKIADVNADVIEFVKGQLAELREDGVPTVDPAEKPRHPRADPPEEVEAKPKLEARRDMLKQLRDMAKDDKEFAKKQGKLLTELVEHYQGRYDRMDARWRATKAK